MHIETTYHPVVPVVPKVKGYTVTLTPEEAMSLHILMGSIVGPQGAIQTFVSDMYRTLQDALPPTPLRDVMTTRAHLLEGFSINR